MGKVIIVMIGCSSYTHVLLSSNINRPKIHNKKINMGVKYRIKNDYGLAISTDKEMFLSELNKRYNKHTDFLNEKGVNE